MLGAVQSSGQACAGVGVSKRSVGIRGSLRQWSEFSQGSVAERANLRGQVSGSGPGQGSNQQAMACC